MWVFLYNDSLFCNFVSLWSLVVLPPPHCLPHKLLLSLMCAEDVPHIPYNSSTCSAACTVNLLAFALLLSPAINFNQILCTQLYSWLKPSKVLLLLRKPLPCYLRSTRLPHFLAASLSPSPPHLFFSLPLRGIFISLHYRSNKPFPPS